VLHQTLAAVCCLVFLPALAAPSGSSTPAAIVLEQPDGAPLELEQPARSLVTLSPHLTELAFHAGAGDLIEATVEYSEYPESARNIPRIGDAFRLDIERIVSMRPDLVIAWDSGNPGPAINQLRSLGLKVWSVEISELEQIPQVIESMGRAVNREEIAAAPAEAFRSRRTVLEERYSDVETMDYFYQVDAQPLFTINGEHLISKALALCGGRNIFFDQPGLAFQVAHEAVVVANPDALFAPSLPGTENPLQGWLSWPGMRAVGREALYLLNADEISRGTPRMLDSLELACKLLQDLRERR
jgi:iron complex transport system substrate-binding protein